MLSFTFFQLDELYLYGYYHAGQFLSKGCKYSTNLQYIVIKSLLYKVKHLQKEEKINEIFVEYAEMN
jgi:hypothetical protein